MLSKLVRSTLIESFLFSLTIGVVSPLANVVSELLTTAPMFADSEITPFSCSLGGKSGARENSAGGGRPFPSKPANTSIAGISV